MEKFRHGSSEIPDLVGMFLSIRINILLRQFPIRRGFAILSILNIWDFEMRSVILISFENFFYPCERARRVGHENQSLRFKTYPQFKKKTFLKDQKFSNFRAIFGPSGIFLNRGLSFKTSDSDFRNLLDEIFSYD